MTRLRHWLALSGIGVLALSAGDARAWTSSGSIEARVNKHLFDRVRVEANECELEAQVFFDAPAEAYQSSAKIRNHYLFRARITFKSGKQVETPAFRSSSAARRVYTHTVKTKDEGCWSKEKSQVIDLDVVGCRGRRCKIPDFD